MKIGIVTLYFNSINYGGNLQAYALCKYFQKKGIAVEQIQFRNIKWTKRWNKALIENGLIWTAYKIFQKMMQYLKNCINCSKKAPYRDEYNRIYNIRKKAFHEFNQEIIPHSERVYTKDDIGKCVDEYQFFITGSDQVWNVNFFNGIFFLDFVPEGMKKISYAASTGMHTFNRKQRELVKENIKDFHAISVREQSDVSFVEELTDKVVSLVVDPTLLLDVDDWDEVTAERVIEEPYIFCYFLGENSQAKKLAEQYAGQKNKKLVDIPYASGRFDIENRGFGHIQPEDVSPQKFLSLIKYADCVFTDSFHAVVFSFIFKRNFFVFNRDKKASMSTRILNITDMFCLRERFCDCPEKEKIEYLMNLGNIDYSNTFEKFYAVREQSYKFLEDNVVNVINEL